MASVKNLWSPSTTGLRGLRASALRPQEPDFSREPSQTLLPPKPKLNPSPSPSINRNPNPNPTPRLSPSRSLTLTEPLALAPALTLNLT